ncbi:MAG: hypothetical protein ABI947_25845 [Chloroflexota bacterium]
MKPTVRILPPITLPLLLSEWVIIFIFVLSATAHLQNWSQDMKLSGAEFASFAHPGGYAATVFQLTGKIPLWNPFNGNGEPMLESPFSYVLNPLMMTPLLLFGYIQGTKLALIIHVGLMGYGGWALARILGLRTPGRLLLALLLLGSGSMSAQMESGFFQLACIQAYIPWLLAGLYGTLYTKWRWPVGIVAVSATMILFAGVFWYVFHIIIMSAVVVAFGVISWDSKQKIFIFHRNRLYRLIWAVLFTLLLSAVRMLPQINSYLVTHPIEIPQRGHPFLDLFMNYFIPRDSPNSIWPFVWESHHYVVAPLLAISILVLRVAIFGNRMGNEWRVLIPGAIIIFIFTYISQGNLPASRWIFETFTFMQQFRQIGRIMAVASPWIIIILAVWFNRICGFLLQRTQLLFKRLADSHIPRVEQGVVGAIALGILFAITIGAYLSIVDVENNWKRTAHVDSIEDSRQESIGLSFLRERYPTKFLPVQSQGLSFRIGYFPVLIRAALGTYDIRTDGVKPTLGTVEQLSFYSEFAAGGNNDFHTWLQHNMGFKPMEGSPIVDGQPVAYQNPNNPPYAFTVTLDTLKSHKNKLGTQDITPVESYNHHIETIDATLNDYPPNSVFVVLEIDYPGWIVTVNDHPAQLESVGGRLGVVLPDKAANTPATRVTFSYRPLQVYVGAWITILGTLLFSAYILRLDEYIVIERFITPAIRQDLQLIADKLKSPELFEVKRENITLPRYRLTIKLDSLIPYSWRVRAQQIFIHLLIGGIALFKHIFLNPTLLMDEEYEGDDE